MAQRPIWRGHLRLALVSCPVALYAAKHDRTTIRFHLINPETGNRIRMITQDAETEKEVRRSDLVKGYEFKKETYVLLTDEDFQSVKVESSSVMTIHKFVDAETIDPIYYDNAYYLAPDGNAGKDVFEVLQTAILRSGRTALSRVVIAQRERVIALRPYEDGLAAHTLSEERDLNDAKGLFEKTGKVDEEMVALATQLIDRQTGAYDAADIEDRYEARLRALIDAKLKGEGIAPEETAEPERTNVVDLMAVLRKSLGQEEETSAPEPDSKPATKRARTKKAASREAAGGSGGKAEKKPHAARRKRA
jgi:DNA end-binding protein Ku